MRTVITGGGLAGLVTARNLARHGQRVTLLERSTRLGGKAGADKVGGRTVEHGYHVFPKWYPNVRGLLDDVGVKLVDFDKYHYLRPAEFPTLVTVRGMSTLGSIVHNTMHGLLPWYQELLFFNFTLDLMSRPLSDKRLLDRISTIGLMRDAWYITEQVAELNQENMLKASAIPAYEMSAMTAKKIGNFWVRQANPFLSVLPGDLQSSFIEPLAKQVRDAGVDVRLEQEVTGVRVDNGRIAAVTLRDGGEVQGDTFVLATPFEVTRQWIDGDVYALDPSLGNMHQLEARPMASLHVKLKKKMAHIPREHVFFHGGEYGLSFIDVSQIWQGIDNTWLSFIASNFVPLASLEDAEATDVLLGEIKEYLPIDDGDIDTLDLHPNVKTPLFINTIAAWPNRPEPKTKIPNLFVAGDYVQNGIDLACMEGAVSAALACVRAVVSGDGRSEPPPKDPPEWSRPLLLAARAALFPPVLAAYAMARVKEALSPTPPAETTTRIRARRRP